jgi:hypothetical protein
MDSANVKRRIVGLRDRKVEMVELWNKRRIPNLFFLLTLLVLGPLEAVSAQSTGQKYTRPIAFARGDGIYITDATGTMPTRIISPVQPDKATHIFSRPRWSPDGQHIVVSDYASQETGESSITLVRVTSQNKQQPLYSLEPNQEMIVAPTAWTPDGTQIAVFDRSGIFLLPAKGGDPKLLYKPEIMSGIGEAGGPEDPSIRLAFREREENRFRTSFFLQSIPHGLLTGAPIYRADGGIDTWGLVSLDGKLVWSGYFASSLVVSPDGQQAVASYAGYLEGYDTQPGNEPIVLVDLKTGKVSPLAIQPGVNLLGWSADGKSIYFSTSAKSDEVEGKFDAPEAKEIFDQYSWPFTAVENTLTLWRIPLDASDKSRAIKLFETKGFSFGLMTVSDTSQPLVFSVVQSSVPMVKAINSGATRQAAEALYPQPVLYAIDPQTGAVRWTMAGGRPAYGKESFVAVAP